MRKNVSHIQVAGKLLKFFEILKRWCQNQSESWATFLTATGAVTEEGSGIKKRTERDSQFRYGCINKSNVSPSKKHKMENFQPNGTSENRQPGFSEAPTANFNNICDDLKTSQEVIQSNAAHLNAIKDQKNKAQVEKADENFDLMIRNAQNVDARTTMLMQENKGVIRRLFPTKLDRLMAEMERNTVKEAMEFRLNLYKLNTQFMLEGMREKYDAALKMIKAEYRSQVAAFMMSKLEGLSKDVQNRQFAFIQMVREKSQFLKTMSDIPSTAERYAVQIEREQDRYFNFLEQLVVNFENIIREELKKFS